jgi:S-(hydroxymethyl)glutathione dehydrogenase/alcohol dehydrogenase
VQAAVLYRASEPLVVEDVELDEPHAGEVLVRLTASGVCHSCLHIMDGSMSWPDMPVVLGDEGAGIVEGVGAGVSSVAPGDHVILSWSPACGRCRYCATGRRQLCERRPARGVMLDGTTRRRVRGRDHARGASHVRDPHHRLRRCAIKIRDDMPLD